MPIYVSPGGADKLGQNELSIRLSPDPFRAGAYNAIDKRRAEKKWSGHARLVALDKQLTTHGFPVLY